MLWNDPDKNERDEAIYDAYLRGEGWFATAGKYRVSVNQMRRIVNRERTRGLAPWKVPSYDVKKLDRKARLERGYSTE